MKVKLKETGKIITGNTPKTSEAENYSSNDIPFIKPSDIHENDILRIGESEYWISEHARKKARILPPNSVLVTCIGIIGKVAINTCECAFNQQINAIIPDSERYLPEYIAYAILAKQKYLQDIANAPVVPIINKSQFADIDIQTIDIQAQKRVVDKLSSVSELIKLNNYRLNKLDELSKSRFVEMFGSEDFSTFKLKEVCSKITDGTHKTPRYQNDGVTFISAKNIVNNQLDFDDVKYISEQEYKEIQRRCQVEKYDVLLSKSGSLGSAAIVNTDEPLGLFESLAVIKYDREILNPTFLCEQLKTDDIQRQFKYGTKGIAIKHLHLNVIGETKVIVPPLELQNQFADFVTKVEKQKATVQQSIDKLETLKKSLMQEYFG